MHTQSVLVCSSSLLGDQVWNRGAPSCSSDPLLSLTNPPSPWMTLGLFPGPAGGRTDNWAPSCLTSQPSARPGHRLVPIFPRGLMDDVPGYYVPQLLCQGPFCDASPEVRRLTVAMWRELPDPLNSKGRRGKWGSH